MRQAERLRDRLAATGEIRADVLLSSTLLRASQTAELVAPALGLPPGTPLVLDNQLVERDTGDPAELAPAGPQGAAPTGSSTPTRRPSPAPRAPPPSPSG